MSYELFQQGPAVYVPILLISLVITVLAYGVFPFIFATTRKSPITKKKYTWLCFGINIIAVLAFTIINGEPSAGGPYALWTWVFSRCGLKILDRRGVLLDVNKFVPTQAPPDSSPEAPAAEAEKHETTEPAVAPPEKVKTKEKTAKKKPSVKYCSRCGNPIDSVSKKCTGCGKQYFKGISLKAFLIGFLIFCLILSLAANVLFVIKQQEEPKIGGNQGTSGNHNGESFYEWLDRQEQEKQEQSSSTPNYTQDKDEIKSTCLAAGCENIPNKHNFYCSEHACAKSGCTSPKSYSSSFCSSHKCDSFGCDNGSNDWGNYCSEHSCAEKNCSNEKNYGYFSVYCSFHECNDVGCENRKKDYGSYCSEHECANAYCTLQKSVLSDYCLIHDD